MYSHNYEDLGDELFQMLCQALLVREFPGVQCLPVGMPDGGRDATAVDGTQRGHVVFQVKFARNPAKLADPAEWVIAAVHGEREKIARLAARGAKEYVMITNVQGTSHLDVGTIDRVQTALDEMAPMPAKCWWRDDVDRRLENAYDLKLRYPTVLSGTDIVRFLWESTGTADNAKRRQTAFNAYLSYHYKEDSTVRFQQVELVSTALLDLFIDVPAVLTSRRVQEIKAVHRTFSAATRRAFSRSREDENSGYDSGRYAQTVDGTVYYMHEDGRYIPAAVGAADLLTDQGLAEEHPNVVIEGAPGQGKSTLTQYLAQLSRARILKRPNELNRFPVRHQVAPLAIPFRIELRDLAAWLKGVDPWTSDSSITLHNRPPTLEGALAGHVERYSGGIVFDVADLNEVLQTMPTLLLLDALDEVADTTDRAAVVSAVQETLARFEGNRISPQVIVTSRPTAIAGSPTFPKDEFLHLSLAPIEHSLALVYSKKWALARRLPEKEREQLPRVLHQKMQAPHIAELAKNTMQLSILLSLVQRRGSSLPDKRTELYNAYFEIFLDRESDKSPVVRDNRDLLFDLHRYLGFHLHAIAEQRRTSGRIAHDRLKWLLRDYLTEEKRPYDLIESLMTGMVERFGALVSRVQGQYEFEVQPLQEYFAARHLNDTAPPSTPGRERLGTKPDRFDGVAPNNYWFNVTRFFAGCFSKGELADLAERVCDLISHAAQQNRPYARSLAVALLQDWVFGQSPRAIEKVVRTVFDDLGLSWALLGYLESDRLGAFLSLPAGTAADVFAQIIWNRIKGESHTERGAQLCGILRANRDSPQIAHDWFEEFSQRPPAKRREWLEIGAKLSVAYHLSQDQISSMMTADAGSSRFVPSMIVKTNLAGRLHGHDELDVEAFRDYLDTPSASRDRPMQTPPPANHTALVAWLTSAATWSEDVAHNNEQVAEAVLTRCSKVVDRLKSPTAEHLRIFVDSSLRWWQQSPRYNLSPWIEVTDALDRTFGRTWTSVELGVIAGAIRDSRERGRGAEHLMDNSLPLPKRVRYAKGRADDAEWWKDQLVSASGKYDVGTWCIALSAWSTGRCFASLVAQIDEALKSLDELSREYVVQASMYASYYSRTKKKNDKFRGTAPSSFLPETLLLITSRLPSEGVLQRQMLDQMSNTQVASECLNWLIEYGHADFPVPVYLRYLRSANLAGATLPAYLRRQKMSTAQRIKISEMVLSVPHDIPVVLISLSTQALLQRQRDRSLPVLEVADDNKWFLDG